MAELPPTHASFEPWKQTNQTPHWERLFRHYMAETKLPEGIIERAEAAYAEHGGELTVKAFVSRASTVQGWERFLATIDVGVPTTYWYCFAANFDYARSYTGCDFRFGGDEVMDAWLARVPESFVKSAVPEEVNNASRTVLALVDAGVNAEYASMAFFKGHSSQKILRSWRDGIPLEYVL